MQIDRVYPPLENPRICPYLGLTDDGQTALAFPSDWNHCYHCKPLVSIRLDHQRNYCLSPQHKSCLVYRQTAGGALPRELRNRGPARPLVRVALWKVILALFFLVLVAGFLLGLAPPPDHFFSLSFLKLPERPVDVAYTPTPLPLSPSPGALVSPTSTMPLPGGLPTHLPTLLAAVSTPSALPGAQPTATITRIPQELETLIGLNYVFKIHRVKQGESLELLAQINGTTTAAMFAVNYHLATPLRTQQIIIIPINQSDVSALPAFEPYRVPEDIGLETLAAEEGLDPTQIQFYNDLGNSDQLYAGEWIILPRGEDGAG
jgi:LysM repeat protein